MSVLPEEYLCSNLAPICPAFLSFPVLDVSIAWIMLVNKRRCKYSLGDTHAQRGANLAPIYPTLLSFPALDVSLANVILSFTSVDVSLARGILMFMGGESSTYCSR